MSVRPTPVIAIDGPSGSGKSSASRGVAVRLGLRYLDTGAMYRAIAWWMLRHQVPVTDADAVSCNAMTPDLVCQTDPAAPRIECDGTDVTTEVRTAEVTAAVSPVSAVPAVRARLVAQQRAIVASALAEGRGIVVEGRDIGTVVLPDARPKIFLTADPVARARRRAREEAVRAGAPDPDAVAEAAVRDTADVLARRDAYDSTRAASPFVRAEDALLLDATDLDLAGVIDAIVSLVDGALACTPSSITS